MKVFIVLLSAIVASAFSASIELPVSSAVKPKEVFISGRIIGGTPATVNQFPWQVSVRSTTAAGTAICGGSLIHPSWVLTAAHCTVGFSSFEIGLGSNALNTPLVRAAALRVMSHPQYNPETLNNDISLIQLASQVALSASIQVIRLATISQKTNTFIGVAGQVSGFGLTMDNGQVSNTLNWVPVDFIANAECASTYNNLIVIESTICGRGYDATRPTSTCNGDSGGPLIVTENGIATQIGVVSFVSSLGCAYRYPHGYVRTSHFVEWISAVTGIAARP